MKKKISGLGIFLMLMLKHPPMPEFAIFQKSDIVAARSFSIRQAALQFLNN
jgi:hypothetical protein